MATRDVPQRQLRNDTAGVLRAVERGDRVRVTVHGRPVAELVPLARPATFVPFAEIERALTGLLAPDDPLDRELVDLAEVAVDPFE